MASDEAALPDGCAVDTVDIARMARLVAELPQDLDKLFASKSAEAGACGIFAGKQVAAKGWCNAYAKKG